MKVYELIQQLGNCPAGSDVAVHFRSNYDEIIYGSVAVVCSVDTAEESVSLDVEQIDE